MAVTVQIVEGDSGYHGGGVSAAVQSVGSGLSDITSGGTITNETSAGDVYEIKITTTGAPDNFQWRKNDGAWSSNVAVTGSAQAIGSEGLTITFAATTGHTLGDTWRISTKPAGFGAKLQAALANDSLAAVSVVNLSDSGYISKTRVAILR